jgi:peptide/nickel transport system substrate-binding protein
MRLGDHMERAPRRTAICLGVLGLVLMQACGRIAPSGAPTPSVAEPRNGGEVVVAVLADLATFNPYHPTAQAEETSVLELLFPSLMTEQSDYQQHPPSFAPRLASSWEFSQDNLTLTFHLRPEARWSDGVPVTADDVRFSYHVQTSREIDWAASEVKSSITDVEVVDAHTVRFHFSRVYPYQLMDANDGFIVPQHAWGKIPLARWATTEFEPLLVTCGPFRLATHVPNQTVVLAREPNFWLPGMPYLDRLVLRVLPDPGSQINQLFSGAVHVVYPVPPGEAARVRNHISTELIDLPGHFWGFILWNNRDPLFADRRVRQALALAINRGSLVDAIYQGYARLAVGPVLSSFWAFNKNLAPLPFDPAAASQILAGAGWRDTDGDGVLDRNGKALRFDLLYPAVNTLRAQAALLVQSDLKRIGVQVRPTGLDFTTMMTRITNGRFQATLSAWDEATKVELTSEWATPGENQGTVNYGGYSNPEVDRLLRSVREEPEFGRAKVLLDRIQEIIVEDQPVAFLYESRDLVGLSRRIRGADVNSGRLFFNVEEWYWSP